MDESIQKLIDGLNDNDMSVRLESLSGLMAAISDGRLPKPVTGTDVNNHIHTTYSFSPYSPTNAVWMAYNAGLATAGIMDHDSISGAEEFIRAGRIAGMATTIGVECRADFSATPLNGRRINNPDQDSVAYVAIHGIPHTQIDKVREFFKPYGFRRNVRNRQMTDILNERITTTGISLDFEKDIAPLSMCHEGGSITERHILYALSLKLIEKYGKGPGLTEILKKQLNLEISPKLGQMLADSSNPYYSYDLLGLLKSEMVASFYVDAGPECPDIRDVIALTKKIGAISAYAYLGDVGQSVTGDKKAQKFEDDYLDLLFDVIKGLGFNAVTYMPSRNSTTQLERLRSLCCDHGFFQISGEDINSPRQSFICDAMKDSAFDNLRDSTWALIWHETAATLDISTGMFSSETIALYPDLQSRTNVYKDRGIRYYNSKQQ